MKKTTFEFPSVEQARRFINAYKRNSDRQHADLQGRLDMIAATLEAAENLAMTADGPVLPTIKYLTEDDIKRIYKLAKRVKT